MTRLQSSSALVATLSVVLLFAVALPASTVAQEREDAIRTADYDVRDLSFPALRDFDTPEPERMTLDNGLTVLLLEDHELPQVHAVARIGTGSVYEPAEKRGLATIAGTVMRTGGTESMTPDSLNQTLENIGATVETYIGQTSGSAYMSTLSDGVDTVLPVFADVLRNPAFAKAKVDQAKSQVKSGISRRNDQARQIAIREFDKLVYGDDSPYARTKEYFTVDRIDRQDLVDFHETYYHPKNVILSVWGDFDAASMKEKIRAAFVDWESPGNFERPTPPKPTTNRSYSVNVIQKSDVTQSTVLIGHPGSLERNDPDYPAVTVMNEVLSGGFSGRLFQNVRSEKGLAYSVFGRYTANYDRPGRFFAGVFSKSPSTVEATNAVMHEVRRMREAPPTDDELSLAKDSYLNSFVFKFDTKREVLGRLMTYQYYDYPQDFLQQTKAGIEEVTAADVERVSNEYLYPGESHILVVGNRAEFSDSLSSLTNEGSVNEIDISIPQRPPGDTASGEPVSAEAKAAGMNVLKEARSRLGGSAFSKVETLRMKGSQTITRGGRTISLDLTVTQSMSGRSRTEVSTPRGEIVMLVNGDKGVQKMGSRSRSMSGQKVEEQKAQLWRSIPYLMANLDREGLTVQDQGTTTVEGTTYQTLKVAPPVGSPYTLYVQPESLRPARLSYTATTRKGPKDASSILSGYKSVSGLQIPHETVTYHDGEKVAETVVSTVTVNPDVEPSLFEVDGTSKK